MKAIQRTHVWQPGTTDRQGGNYLGWVSMTGASTRNSWNIDMANILKGTDLDWGWCSLRQRFSILVLGTPCPACFGYFPAPTHLIQINRPYNDQFIWIRCVGAGKRLKHAGQGIPRTRIENHCSRERLKENRRSRAGDAKTSSPEGEAQAGG